MKSFVLILLLSFVIVAECDIFTKLNKAIRKYPGMEMKMKRQSSNPKLCPRLECLNTGQSCARADCGASCLYPKSQCVFQFQSGPMMNKTANCFCYRNCYDCMLRVGGFCAEIVSSVDAMCQAETDACNCTSPNIIVYSKGQCSQSDWCENNTICQPRPLFGQYCFGKDSCGDYDLLGGISPSDVLTCLNTTKVCSRLPGTVSVGNPCTKTADCIGGNVVPARTNCTGGVCVGMGPNRGPCSGTAECAFGLYCKNGACIPQLAANASCTILDDTPCVTPYTCSREAKCIPVLSKPLGAACEPDNPALNLPDRNECVLGTFCSDYTQTCIAPIAPTLCNPLAPNCPGGTECNCDGNGNFKCIGSGSLLGYVNPSCRATFITLLDCLAKVSCKGDLERGGCGEKYCYNEIQCHSQCYYTSIQANYPFNLGCTGMAPPTFNCSAPTSATGGSGTDITSSGYSLRMYFSMLVALALAIL